MVFPALFLLPLTKVYLVTFWRVLLYFVPLLVCLLVCILFLLADISNFIDPVFFYVKRTLQRTSEVSKCFYVPLFCEGNVFNIWMLLKLFKLRLIQACIWLCFAILCPFCRCFLCNAFYIRKPVLWMFLDLPTLLLSLIFLDEQLSPPVNSVVKTEQGSAQMK